MKTLFEPRAEFDEHGLRSSLDPLLYGVAHGLASLFPPIEILRQHDAETEAGQLRDGADEHFGE